MNPNYSNMEGDYTPRGGAPLPQPGIIPQSGMPSDLGNLDEGYRSSEDRRAERPTDPTVRARNRATNAANKRTGAPTEEDEILKLLQEFYAQFNAPLDYNDPFVKSLLDQAQQSTMQSANNAGIFGGYSQNLAQQAYVKSQAGLQQQKQQMAGNALGMLRDYKINKRDWDYNRAKDSYQAALDQWKMQGDQNADLWRMVGGGLGAAVGGVGGFLVGGPPGAVTGASAGFGAGQQIAGGAHQAFGGQFNPMPKWDGGGKGF